MPSHVLRPLCPILAVLVALTATSSSRASGPAGDATVLRPVVELGAGTPWGDDRFVDPMTAQGQQARGLYFNGPVLKRLGAAGVVRAVRGANMNAAVFDLKDGEGRVLFDTKLPELQPQKRLYVKDLPRLIAQVREAGVYVIARIVCFSDPVTPRNHPDRAVMDVRPKYAGEIWAGRGKRNPWLDPYNERNHDMVVGLASEAQALGVDEVQFDYFRFPVDEAIEFATFPAQRDIPRRQVLLGLLRRVDAALHIPIGVDVFGLTTFRVGDPAGLGQSLEDFAQHLDVFSPMLYLNGMGAWMRGDGVSDRAGRLVAAGVKMLRQRVGYGPVIRPFLQAFPNGADHYDPQFIAEQIGAARPPGADGFLFWHPGSNYAMVTAGALGPGRSLIPFPFEERFQWRQRNWMDRMSPGARASYQARDSASRDEASGATSDTAGGALARPQSASDAR
jgi:hypothetical protein